MINSPEKRFFFKTVLKDASQTLGIIADSADDHNQVSKEKTFDISSDLPPELMAMEAQRLGLDPIKDRNRVLQSIQDAMRGSDT